MVADAFGVGLGGLGTGLRFVAGAGVADAPPQHGAGATADAPQQDFPEAQESQMYSMTHL